MIALPEAQWRESSATSYLLQLSLPETMILSGMGTMENAEE